MFQAEFFEKRIRRRIFAWFLMFFSGLIVAIYHPSTEWTMMSSPVRTLTGFYCPGCGSVRAMMALLQGQLLKALSHNVMAVLFSPLLLYTGLSVLLTAMVGKSLPAPRVSSRMIWIVLISLLMFAVFRNIPISALEFLRP